MICKHCGKGISLTDTCLVEFKGVFLQINAKFISCRVCAFDTLLEVKKEFPESYLKKSFNVRFAVGEGKVKSDDKYFNEILHH